MKWFFAVDYAGSSANSISEAIAAELVRRGHTVDTMAVDRGYGVPQGFDKSLSSYDIAHFFNARCTIPFRNVIDIPRGMTIHGFVEGYENVYFNHIEMTAPDWVHVMDVFSQHMLGRHGIVSVRTHQCITTDWLRPLPTPAPVTIGYLGGDREGFKRFPIIHDIAKQTGVECVGHNASDKWLTRDEVLAHYERIGVYVDAHWGSCGALPPQEALLCGRPVLATPVEAISRALIPGFNGEFFDGSVRDGVRKLRRILADYAIYAHNARQATLPTAEAVADTFEQQASELVNEG